MATGEVKWSAKGQAKVERFTFALLPKGEYDLKFNADAITQKKGDKPGQVPYINLMLDALGTAQGDSGKNAKIFHKFFLHLSVSEKDGKVMVARQGGILDFCQAVGDEPEFSQIQVPYQKYKDNGDKDGPMVRINILNPAEVLAWLKSKDGLIARAQVKVQKGKGGYDDSNVIDYWVPAEDAGTEEEFSGLDDGSEEAPEEGELQETNEEEALSEEAPAEEEAAEEEPEEDMTAAFNAKAKAAAAAKAAPKPAAKLAPKAPAKPAPKPAVKGKR